MLSSIKSESELDFALDTAIQAIDMLTDEQKITLRKALERQGNTCLPRNLYYNYQTQKWIGY